MFPKLATYVQRLTWLTAALHVLGWLAGYACADERPADPIAPTHGSRIEGTIHDGDTVTKCTVHLDEHGHLRAPRATRIDDK